MNAARAARLTALGHRARPGWCNDSVGAPLFLALASGSWNGDAKCACMVEVVRWMTHVRVCDGRSIDTGLGLAGLMVRLLDCRPA